jgi:hypothetical protein
MNSLLLIFVLITVLFVILLLVKGVLKRKFCVICASVSLTWVTLLVLYWLGRFDEPVLIAVLMGQSIVGMYYLLEKKLPEQLHLFRLPFLLSATFVVYVALSAAHEWVGVAVLLAVMWFVLIGVYVYRSNPRMSRVMNRIIACCKDW